MYIWYDDRFTQMKRSNAHEVTLRAVLGMLFTEVESNELHLLALL